MTDGRVVLTLETFMLFWGVVFMIVTCAVWIGKKEGKQTFNKINTIDMDTITTTMTNNNTNIQDITIKGRVEINQLILLLLALLLLSLT